MSPQRFLTALAALSVGMVVSRCSDAPKIPVKETDRSVLAELVFVDTM